MTTYKKTDNADLASKVAIRRWLLQQADLGPLRVLDTCAGRGLIWKAMREFVHVAEYTPWDIKPRMPGTIKVPVDSLTPRFLSGVNMDSYNVVDIDTYGCPFEAFGVLADKARNTTAFFLTHGIVSAGRGGSGGSTICASCTKSLGLPRWKDIPKSAELHVYAAKRQLDQRLSTGAVSIAWKISLPRVTYYAILLKPND